MAQTVVSSRTPHSSSSSPPRPTSARNAVPTTTVGSTKGTVTTARSTCLPGKSRRAKTYAPGSATTSVSAVAHRVDEHVQRHVLLELLGDQEVEEGLAALGVLGVAQQPGVLDLPEAGPVRRPGRRGLRLRVAVDDLGGRRGGVGDDERP